MSFAAPNPSESDLPFAQLPGPTRVVTRPLPEEWRAAAVPRAPRFSARLVVWCRVCEDPQWYQGLTENVSRTGVLFRVDFPVPPQAGALLEIALEIPAMHAQDPPIEFRSLAEVVRVEQDLPEMLPKVAVALRAPLRPGAASDGFALILSSVREPRQVVSEPRPGAAPRAPRYVVRLPVRYRLTEVDDEWHAGETENISQSGVAFQTHRSDLDFAGRPPSEDGVSIEIVIELPGTARRQSKVVVSCEAVLVRTSRDLGLGGSTHVAVKLQGSYAVGAAAAAN